MATQRAATTQRFGWWEEEVAPKASVAEPVSAYLSDISTASLLHLPLDGSAHSLA